MSYEWHPQKFNAKLHARLIELLTICALIVLADAIRLCPVDTGRLRSSLTYEVHPAQLRARVGTNVLYALFVFLGTHLMAPRPILTQSLEMNKQECLRRVKRGLRAA